MTAAPDTIVYPTAMFYLSAVPGPDRQPITLPDGRRMFIRVEFSSTKNLADALADARLQRGEMFMNTHPVGGARQ